jgi:hypothetical protein
MAGSRYSIYPRLVAVLQGSTFLSSMNPTRSTIRKDGDGTLFKIVT